MTKPLSRRAALAALSTIPLMPSPVPAASAVAAPPCPFLAVVRRALAAGDIAPLATLGQALLLLPPETAPDAARLIAQARFDHGAYIAAPTCAEALAQHLEGAIQR